MFGSSGEVKTGGESGYRFSDRPMTRSPDHPITCQSGAFPPPKKSVDLPRRPQYLHSHLDRVRCSSATICRGLRQSGLRTCENAVVPSLSVGTVEPAGAGRIVCRRNEFRRRLQQLSNSHPHRRWPSGTDIERVSGSVDVRSCVGGAANCPTGGVGLVPLSKQPHALHPV